MEICSDQLRLFDTVIPIYLWLSTIWTSSFLMITGECFLSPFLKSRIISLVLGTLRSRKWISHHSTKLSISLLYTVSSSFTIKPWMVESSANFKRQTWILFSETQSFVYIVNITGDRTQPWGAPVLVVILSEKMSLFENC